MAHNKIIYDNQVLIDLTNDTVTPDKLLFGITAHDKSGSIVTGTLLQRFPPTLTVEDKLLDSYGDNILDIGSAMILGRAIYVRK